MFLKQINPYIVVISALVILIVYLVLINNKKRKTSDFTFNSLVLGINSPIVYVDDKGIVLNVNRPFMVLAKTEYLNSIYDDNYNIYLKQVLIKMFSQKIRQVKVFNIDGLDYEATFIPIIENKQVISFFVVLQDISKRIEGEKMQKRFIADASHELRTPIASIKGLSEILNNKDYQVSSEDQESFLDSIIKESNRLERIVSDLLLQSRMSENRIFIDRSHFNLDELFDELKENYHSKLNNRNIVLDIRCNKTQMIYADRFRLYQVFENLMQNALNYASGTKIEITVLVKDNLVIKFKDYGEGIDEENIKHIFERFYRVEKHRNRDTGGSGLGLPIVKSIIEAHDGLISVNSKVGEFTEFTIELTVY